MYNYGLVCYNCLTIKWMCEVPSCFPEAYLPNYPVRAANSRIRVTIMAVKTLLHRLTPHSHLNPPILQSDWLLKQLLSSNNAISQERNANNQ